MTLRTIVSDPLGWPNHHSHKRGISFAKLFQDIKKKTRSQRQVTFSPDPPRVYEYEVEYDRPLMIRTYTMHDFRCDPEEGAEEVVESMDRTSHRPRRRLDLRPIPNNAFFAQQQDPQLPRELHGAPDALLDDLFKPVESIQLLPPSPPPSPDTSTVSIPLPCPPVETKPIVARTLTRLRSSSTLLQRIF